MIQESENILAGLISPSKYNGYIYHGLPLIYIGPHEVAPKNWTGF